MRKFNIHRPDKIIRNYIQNKIDNLNKPKGALGRLETLAMQICLIEQSAQPTLHHPCHLLFGADHGIERAGVSVSPREVTWQQMINFAHGGGGVNMFCRQHHFDLHIIDVGVDHNLTEYPLIINRKIANGTNNFMYEAAMSQEQFEKAINTGCEMAELCFNKGSDVICIGEMGIGNTSASSIWMSLLGNLPLNNCIGAGSGLNTEGIEHKRKILNTAVDNFNKKYNPDDYQEIIRYFGGYEMVAAVGAMLRAAELHLIILIDGFIMTACALAAYKLYPEIKDYMIFGHCGDEEGHRKMLDLLHAEPLLQLNLRLGEGTGALCAYPILESSIRMINEMNNFENAKITKYF